MLRGETMYGKAFGLRECGLTNHHTEDIGVLATATVRMKNYATCCGKVYLNTNRDICLICRHSLEWKLKAPSVADKNIKNYREKWSEKNKFNV